MFAGDWFEGERVSRELLEGGAARRPLLLREKVGEKLADPRRGPGICVLSRDVSIESFLFGVAPDGSTYRNFPPLVLLLPSFSTWMRKEEEKRNERMEEGRKEGKGANESGEGGGRESGGIRILRRIGTGDLGYSRSTREGKDGK